MRRVQSEMVPTLKRGAKAAVSQAVLRGLGYRRARHLGRWLCVRANADAPGEDYDTNGEGYLIRSVLASPEWGEESATVLDVGASTGQFAQHVLGVAQQRGLAGLDYHAFEPVRASHTNLERLSRS